MANIDANRAHDNTVKGNSNSGQDAVLCMIVGWRRIKGSFADLHAVADNGTILVREGNDFRVMYSEGVLQGLRS